MSGIENAVRNKPFAALIHDLEGVMAKMLEDGTSMKAAARGSLLAEGRALCKKWLRLIRKLKHWSR
jgi:hypothetical protein